eukprot:8368120-Pyramimonas_sp.AAC.1
MVVVVEKWPTNNDLALRLTLAARAARHVENESARARPCAGNLPEPLCCVAPLTSPSRAASSSDVRGLLRQAHGAGK